MNNKTRYALVTGASRGIGRAIAIELAKDGCHVIINYLSNHDAARQTLQLIEQTGGTGELLPFDVSKPEEINKALDDWFAKHENEYIDVLVNNAGIVDDDLMLWMTPEQWHSVIDVNLNGFFYTTQRLLEGMLVNRHGRVINISSISGQMGVSGKVSYSAAKAALIGATRSLAAEVTAKNITVNAVSPGAIETDMTDISQLKEKEVFDDTYINSVKNIPAKRLGKPQEVAYLVSFLCSNKADYISGQVIGINGGVL